ncbi:MAG: glycosyltransferase family 39 protein [Drouetiella hepatica Uher 2000/2452]|uniref:Glycosyltransferase family 39 protein n=1 Tax=Drouetiella hepatica Uher 2000/2452 TaxID=904376 RepID=A0A951QEF3_9CYAN|nr:glycosyltransferase family 39 protein [Drouetiella hepatica Uher 2000/2452]
MLKYIAIALLILGTFFRFYHLDEKVYWLDEARTSLRMSGHTKTEFIQTVYQDGSQGRAIGLDELQQFQRPGEASWGDTFNALKGNAEHTPLYFVLARVWTETFGYSVTTIRSLSAVISLLVFPCLFWLCRELFKDSAVGWVALALAAISPLHVLYSQEARPYSLWTVTTLLSSAVLLWAMRSPSRNRWMVYGVTIALGLYTQLLFALVAIAQGLYVAILPKRRSLILPYLWATLGGVLAFVPWLVLLLSHIEQVNAATIATTRKYPLSYLLDQWFLNINRVFINGELGSYNLLLVVLTIAALYWLCRKTQRRTWAFIFCLIAVPFLALALPDLLMGGERSLRIRYLIPAYLGIQIAFAHLFATQAAAKTWGQKLGRMVLILLIVSGTLACAVNTQTQVGWSKSIRKSGYYPVAAGFINHADRPLVISDDQTEDILSFSYELKPDVKFQLITSPRRLKIAAGYGSVFLLNPSDRLKNLLEKRGSRLLLLCQDEDENPGKPEDRLWLVKQGF